MPVKPIPGDIALFDAPDPPDPVAARKMPLAPPADYLAAVERTDGQCEHVKTPKRGNAKPERCTRTLRGGHRLYLGDDGKLSCQQHYDEARKAART